MDIILELGSDQIVYLAKSQYDDLCQKYGQEFIDDKIEDLNDYIMVTHKIYESHYHALKIFIRNDECTCGARKKRRRSLDGTV